MSNTKHRDHWQIPESLGPCVCAQLRRAARKASALYDRSLAPTGLSVTQYSVLMNIARAGKISRSALAAQLGMDRTTLTRDLKPLEKAKLVAAAESDDLRERLLQLSPAGKRRLRRSYQRWANTQKAFAAGIGRSRLEALRIALAAVEAAAETLSG